jgi:hypothetical protein
MIFIDVGIKMILINREGLRRDLIRRFVLLDGFEVELYRLFRPIDELVGALRMGLASGE